MLTFAFRFRSIKKREVDMLESPGYRELALSHCTGGAEYICIILCMKAKGMMGTGGLRFSASS